MNDDVFCGRTEEEARELARGGGDAELRGHVAGCRRCQRRLVAERDLDAGLRALAAEEVAGAPPRVEAAWRAGLRRRAGRRRWWIAPAAGLVAAAAAVVALWPRTMVRPPEVPREEGASSDGPFLPIGDPARLRQLEVGAIVRMRVPGMLPVLFGWPLADAPARTADVLVGEDGVARGIRFLPVRFEAAKEAGR